MCLLKCCSELSCANEEKIEGKKKKEESTLWYIKIELVPRHWRFSSHNALIWHLSVSCIWHLSISGGSKATPSSLLLHLLSPPANLSSTGLKMKLRNSTPIAWVLHFKHSALLVLLLNVHANVLQNRRN